MAASKYDIFISYRRVGGAHYARILKAELEKRGYRERVFLDYDELNDGKFDRRIMQALEDAPVFIFILSPGSLDRCSDEDDWVRQEILHAFKHERHIVPVNFDGLFKGFGRKVPEKIREILGQQQFSKIDSEQLLNVSIEKLIKDRIAPVVEPYRSGPDTASPDRGAEIVVLADCDCEIYRFGKLLGKVRADGELTINLLKGNHLLEFVSADYPEIREKHKLSIPDIDYTDFIEVTLKDRIEATDKLKTPEEKGAEKYQQAWKYYNEGPDYDLEKAVRLIRESAGLGYADAQYTLGLFCHAGIGMPEDEAEAAEWYRKAAMQGIADAAFYLGTIYEGGAGVARDYAEAAKWYRQAAEKGNSDAQCNLGVFYDRGRGVAQDYSEALKWYHKSAEQGNAVAQHNLGYMYSNGKGVPQDYAEAVKWYRQAAEKGHSGAQSNLGSMYLYGEGVAQDYVAAVKCFRQAADQGLHDAQYNLGGMYERGIGVVQNYEEAIKWYRMAAEQGQENAKDALARLGY